MTNLHSALRAVMQRAPQVRPQLGAAAPLEQMPADAEPPSIIDAQVVEDATVRARSVPGDPAVGFLGFLDGTQKSEVIAWDGPAPIVLGRVAAAVRIRMERRLVTWRQPLVTHRLYIPFAYSPRAQWAGVFPSESLVDTTPVTAHAGIPVQHPTLLLERARHAVQLDRERAEQRLAAEWCVDAAGPLFVDGSISGSDIVARASCTVGVIKSHRMLYTAGAAADVTLALRAGQRTPVFRIAPRSRSSVYSWYLRLRDFTGHDAMWGLVRVEVAETDRVTERADEVSRWVLAEMAPNAMPDTRWDKMAYGVRNCETFLRAIS